MTTMDELVQFARDERDNLNADLRAMGLPSSVETAWPVDPTDGERAMRFSIDYRNNAWDNAVSIMHIGLMILHEVELTQANIELIREAFMRIRERIFVTSEMHSHPRILKAHIECMKRAHEGWDQANRAWAEMEEAKHESAILAAENEQLRAQLRGLING